MRLHPTPAFRRPGFTLIEVLVAAGLCMLIMAVLAEAFGAGVGTFSLLKSTGELDGRLKTAQAILRSDLQLPHLEAETGEPVRVSQLRLDRIGAEERFARPQPFGFFRITQETASTSEGNDPDGIPSTRATNHTLQMAVRVAGTRTDKIAVAKMPKRNGPTDTPVGPGLSAAELGTIGQAAGFSLTSIDTNVLDHFASQWYEVSYFLNSQQTGATSGGQPLFSLHRRVRAVLPKAAPPNAINWSQFNNTNTDPSTATTGAPGMSYRMVPQPNPQPPAFFLNNASSITEPTNRTGGLLANRQTASIPAMDTATNHLIPLGTGEDILLTNVLSFEVKASWDGINGVPVGGEFPFADLPAFVTAITATAANGTGNPNFLRVDAGGNPIPGSPALRAYDTWSSSGPFTNWAAQATQASAGPPPVFLPNPAFVPLPIRLKAVQIKVRLYDPKNKLTRQMTLVQDL